MIFVVLMFVLSKFAFGPLTQAVEARERRSRTRSTRRRPIATAAARCSSEHGVRSKPRATRRRSSSPTAARVAEKMRADMIEQTRKEQQDMLDRARREIEAEKDKAIAQLRREAVDLAIAGASKVIEQNLESQKNRQLVESYLALDRNAQGRPVMRDPTIAKNYAETLLELAQRAERSARVGRDARSDVADAMETDAGCGSSSSRRA